MSLLPGIPMCFLFTNRKLACLWFSILEYHVHFMFGLKVYSYDVTAVQLINKILTNYISYKSYISWLYFQLSKFILSIFLSVGPERDLNVQYHFWKSKVFTVTTFHVHRNNIQIFLSPCLPNVQVSTIKEQLTM